MSSTHSISRQVLWILSIPLIAVGFWAEWRDFLALWRDSIVYNHGYLVLAGVAYLLVLQRDKLASLNIVGSPLALTLLTAASVLLVLAQAADIRVIRLLLVPIVIILWGWSIWGLPFVKIAGGPLLMLIFAVPIWDDLSPWLQFITVFFNNLLLNLFDIEATINEFLIVLDVGVFHVENGCSGVRYLMVAMFLAAFYGQIYYQSFTSKTLLILIAALLSMVSNWIRVFGIIVAGHYTNMETELVEDHELFGWAIFVLFTLIPMFFITGVLAPPASASREQPRSVAQSKKWATNICPIIASLLLLWPAILAQALETQTEELAKSWNPSLVEPPRGWRGPLPHASIWRPRYTNPDIDLSGVYVSDDLKQVQLQIIGYRRQLQNKELIFHRNRLFDSRTWRLVSSEKRPLAGASTQSPPTVNETILQHREDDSTVILWSWYAVGGYLTDSRTEAKIAGALKKLSGDNRGALWALAGRCSSQGETNCEPQRTAFERFLHTVLN
ncbi:EpsI family protein [Marinobacter salinisoli]|uniref:EpsI family protein n=1 Tax=Marinobacter salinisoli TaxID=2769486 RepID=A0ABX7MQK3_9GAMM|nr:exosortase A [Marinobacter salinisoli]QSP93695.1 EpsI family protein [Marinobacter salinisoli]